MASPTFLRLPSSVGPKLALVDFNLLSKWKMVIPQLGKTGEVLYLSNRVRYLNNINGCTYVFGVTQVTGAKPDIGPLQPIIEMENCITSGKPGKALYLSNVVRYRYLNNSNGFTNVFEVFQLNGANADIVR